MSGETPARGLPHHLPTVPSPLYVGNSRSILRSQSPWQGQSLVPLGRGRGSPWPMKPVEDGNNDQGESIDLSTPAKTEPLRNGEKSPVNGQVCTEETETAPKVEDEPIKTEPQLPPKDSNGTVEEKSEPPPPDEPQKDVESLLENMFQGETKEEEEVDTKKSVIVSNNSSALTEDKVVAILEEKSPINKIEPKVTPMEVDESKVKEEKPDPPKNTAKEDQENKNPFIEVETELEKMFAGIVEPADEVAKPPSEAKKKRKSSSKPKAKKSDESSKKRPGKKDIKSSDPRKKMKFGRDKIPKEASNDSFVVTKSRGPFLRIKGGKDNPESVTVVNSAGKDEEEKERGSDKASNRKKSARYAEGRLKGPGLYSSTLSARYNSTHIDPTWVCIFCKQRPHCPKGLGGEPAGDLFGPYHLKVIPPSETQQGIPSDSEVSEEQKIRGGGRQLSLRAAGVAHQFTSTFNKKSKQPQKPPVIEENEQEVWLHEQCAVWAPGVVLVGPHLIGLDEAVSAASVTKCSHCGEMGASLGCVVRGCPARCHYGCAQETSWNLNQETFIARCAKHSIVNSSYMTMDAYKRHS